MLIKNRHHCCPKSKSLRGNLASGNFPWNFKTVCTAFVMVLGEPHDFGKEECVAERFICDDHGQYENSSLIWLDPISGISPHCVVVDYPW